MQTLKFTTEINSTAEHLWKCLWQPETYTLWTIPFAEGCYYKTDSFSEGSIIHFLSPSGEGMYSKIEKMDLNKHIMFRHLGMIAIIDGKEVINESNDWVNAIESYEIVPNIKGVHLNVSVDIVDEYADYMNKTFPLALEKLKEIAEG